jgi:predicted ArsR family transcriptional regulator
MKSARTSTRTEAGIGTPGLGESQRLLLETLKRGGESTLAELERAIPLAPETLRSHLTVLVAQGLVERSGVLRSGPGRPRVRYRLAGDADVLFPRRDRELLGELARFLVETGRGAVLEEFFTQRLARKRAEAEARLVGVPLDLRLEAVAQLLSDDGFLAEVVRDATGQRLRLCHCPVREFVDVSRLPCRAEMALVGELLGAPLHRESFIPDGAASCTYALGPAEIPVPDPMNSEL